MSEAKRIAYLVSRYPAVSHTFILREVRMLRRLGWTLRVASINPTDRVSEALTPEEREEAAATFYVKSAALTTIIGALARTLFRHPSGLLAGLWAALCLGGGGFFSRFYNLFYWVEAAVVGIWMEEQGLHHLHVHFLNPASTVGLLVSKMFPISFSITVHGPDEFFEVSKNELVKKVQAASFISCISQYARGQLMRLSAAKDWEKLFVLPLGVDTTRFRSPNPPQDGNVFEVLSVGRLVAAKGQDLLLEAIASLMKQGRKIRLRLIGDGPERLHLENRVRQLNMCHCVIFEGAVAQDKIVDFYAHADAFALASFAEGVPVVLMEAMAMGIPCIATRIAGIPELIRDNVDGLLVAASDRQGLATAIARLMDDKTLRQKLGHAGRRRIEEEFDIQQNTRALSLLFEKRLVAIP